MGAWRLIGAFGLAWLAFAGIEVAAEEKPVRKPLIDFGADGAETRVKGANQSDAQIERKTVEGAKGKALEVTIKPGASAYPGIEIKPEGGAWDLAAFGHVEARVVNTGAKPLSISLRVDNAGDWRNNPWNTEQANLKPGEAGTITTIFGHSYGQKPGYALNASAVVNVLLFVAKSDSVQSFRVEAIEAGGPAGEKPSAATKDVRIRPKDGVLFAAGLAVDAARQIEAKGAQASVEKAGLRVVFPAGKGERSVALKPEAGRWDLREAFEIRVKVKNEGQTPVTPSVQAIGNGGSTVPIAAAAPLAPGAEQEIAVPFAPAKAWTGLSEAKGGHWAGQPGTGTSFGSDAVGAVKIAAVHEGEATLLVESVSAGLGACVLPEWLGKRPPVDGDWVQTFADEFDGPNIDATKWNVAGPNYWDKASHWSKDNTVVGDGVVRLRYERKAGHQNDDPNEKRTDYAGGFLETYGKWVQRYGYFEARMKLPRAPGLWPAFWLMPDRGAEAGPQWKRQDTGNGGMEFDVMEHLTRWGPCRYNIAMHWDGYQKDHKAIGSQCVYVRPDKDGFIACGLLWLPGQAVYYGNGVEVARWECPRVSSVQSDMMFTMPQGGWDNSPIDDAQLPAEFVIDYVRVWQRKDLASPVDGYKFAPKPEAKTQETKKE